jgi:2-oxoisovalerate dehydrogenase E1 component beta subunit
MARTSGYFGGVFRRTGGLQKQFGKTRCFDAPISEGGIVGTAIGMAAYGLKPVIEIQFADYIYPGYDQIVSEVAKIRYRTAGEWTMPMVIRSPYGGGIFGGQTHSQVARGAVHPRQRDQDGDPVQPYDAKGLLIAAIEDPGPGALLRAQADLQRPVRRPSRQAGHAMVEACAEPGARRPLFGAAGQGERWCARARR